LEDLGVGGKIILKLSSENRMGRGVAVCGSGCREVSGCCGHGNELPLSIKGGELLDWLNKC
jgi:hypothetical protein